MPLTLWQAAQRHFDTSSLQRRWPGPGAMAQALDPLTRQTPALEAIDEHLVAVADGDIDRLMVLMPPQEGKSERISRRFPEWVLSHRPNTRFSLVSFADERARRWGRFIKSDLEQHPELGLRLRRDSKAAGRWGIAGYRGGVYCVGVAGQLTGEPVDVMVIDDPIADLEHALSPVYRERAKRFWQSVAVPRLGPQSRVVLVQTRWHEDDLAGWLQATNADRWTVLKIPAVAEDTVDVLGRDTGEGMLSARGNRDWASVRTEVGAYVWAAEYQQRPAPAEGGMFKRTNWRYWEPAGPDLRGTSISLEGRVVPLDECWRFATVDLATSTKTSADYTVAGAWAVTPGGDLVLLDRVRQRIEEADHWAHIRPLVTRHRVDVTFVESRMFGTTLVYEAGRAGIGLRELKADTDKFTRALPAAARQEQGRVWLPAGVDWLEEWVDELAAFPNGAHDDQVDVMAYAARVVAAYWLSPGTPAELDRRSWPDDGAIDFLTAPM